MSAPRPCLDCGTPTHGSRCRPCHRTRETALYGGAHQRQRQQWADLIARGNHVPCGICGYRIAPAHAWDLDHSTHSPTHAHCNRSQGASQGR